MASTLALGLNVKPGDFLSDPPLQNTNGSGPA